MNNDMPANLPVETQTIYVNLQKHAYNIHIGPDLLSYTATLLNDFKASRFVIVTDTNVEAIYGSNLQDQLEEAGIRTELVSFSAGEASKNMDTILYLAKELIRLGADRKTMLLALGGGVTGDITGFLASIYMRGVPFIQIPTTLLAQVDSSVGGKTGVDLAEGKNLLGTFYQPKLVLTDVNTLSTLPKQELKNGLAEVIKYAMIRSPKLFQILEEKWNEVLELDSEVITTIVALSCAIKAEIVEQDEKEAGLRRILNFGHTAGHAIEAAADYTISHGEAVNMGMVVAARMAFKRELMGFEEFSRFVRLLERFDLPYAIPARFSPKELLSIMKHDKKMQSGELHYVLNKGIGDCEIVVIPDEEIIATLEECTGTLSYHF
ncbi:MAG: 3-dehydroquinate synthase [Dissulfuribacterales bacterium]